MVACKYTIGDYAKVIGKSLSHVNFIFNRVLQLQVEKIIARWIPYILLGPKTGRSIMIQTASNCSNCFPHAVKDQFFNIVTGDKTVVYNYKPVRNMAN